MAYLHVDEGRAGKVLGDGERDEPEHGESAVPELGVGGHEPAAPALGALPLEHRRQRRGGQDDGGVREPGEPRAVPGLREEAVAACRLDGERRHEAHHRQPPVDPLRRRPAERQRVPEPRRLRSRSSSRGLTVLGLLGGPDEQRAAARRDDTPGRRGKMGGSGTGEAAGAGARAGAEEGEGARGRGGHHRGRHRRCTYVGWVN